MSIAIEQGWKLLVLPAVLDELDEPCVLLDDDGREVWRDTRKPGEPLVELLTTDALARLKVELGSIAFAAQYKQRPADDDAATIRRRWWSYYRPRHASPAAQRPDGADESRPVAELPDAFARLVIACDPTFGSLTGDWCAIQCWGADGGARFLLDRVRLRGGFETQLDALAAMAERWPTAKIVVEAAANGRAIIETLRKRLPNVCAVKPLGSKHARLAAIAPTVESGSCHLPLGAPWLDDFLAELAGSTRHDDEQDAAVYALHDLLVRDTALAEPVAPRLFTGNDSELPTQPGTDHVGTRAFVRAEVPPAPTGPADTLFMPFVGNPIRPF